MTSVKHLTYQLSLEFSRPRFEEMNRIERSKDVAQFIKDRVPLGRLNHKELFFVIILTKANRILGFSEIASGNGNSVILSLKEIAQICILGNASGCILVHNHPSGGLTPSECDLKVTRKVQEVLKLIEVTLLDHLIITQEDYFSFADDALLIHP